MSQSANGPDLRQLRIQAKELVRAVRAADQSALARVVAYFSSSSEFTLANAQLVIARENGFESWPRMRRALDGAESETPRSPADLLFSSLDEGNDDTAIELLAEHPELAGVSRRTRYGGWENPLHVAAAKGRLIPTRALVEAGAAIYAVGQGDYPPVFEAVHAGHKEVADFLLEASAASDGGIPPTYGCGIDIVLATRLGMLDRVRMHVERDPLAVYRRGCIGESVLHWPAHNGHVEIVSYLLDSGAMIAADEIGLYGGKPLHWAAEHAPACVRLLLERGADPNCRNLMHNDFEGYTPLHMMARQPNQELDCARLLLDAGADPTLVDARNETALDVAIKNGREKTRQFLADLAR